MYGTTTAPYAFGPNHGEGVRTGFPGRAVPLVLLVWWSRGTRYPHYEFRNSHYPRTMIPTTHPNLPLQEVGLVRVSNRHVVLEAGPEVPIQDWLSTTAALEFDTDLRQRARELPVRDRTIKRTVEHFL